MKTLLACLVLVLAATVMPLVAQPRAPEREAAKLSEAVTALENNKPVDVTVTEAEHFLRCFTFTVPQNAKSLHIATVNATGDIDLMICFNKQAKTLEDLEEKCDHVSSTARFNEVFTINATNEPPLAAGTYYVYAGSLQAEGEEEITFTIAAALDVKPTLKTQEPRPYLVTKPEALQRAIDTCVRIDSEVSTGSGTIVSPKGLILTCCHVIETDDGGYLKKDIYISVTRDPRKDPVQSYLAQTVFVEKALDLALLRIVSDLDGKTIEKPSFPFSPLGDDTRLMLGEEINCLGYPGIGGSRSIYGITLTRGIAAGFIDRKGSVQFIKTDALISAGNSGGGAFNAKYELIGVPSEAMHAEGTFESLGYLRPVSAMPENWRKLIYEEYPK
ncbi:Putative serine protease HhoA [Planctomycetaceae bacterium]|nr:Putative serine protease HhoA [Planctomycetaceae bacterium]